MKQRPYLLSVLIATLVLSLICAELHAAQSLIVFPKGLKPNGLVFALSLFFGLFVALAVHELGHLLTGLAQGFRFELFVIFVLGVKRTENGIKLYFNKNLGYMGGIAASVPTEKLPENRKKFALMVIAGPLASLAFGLICFGLLALTKNMLFTFWLVAGSTSIGLFFATTIPSKSGIFFTDRARFQRLISKSEDGKAEEALLSIMAQTTASNSCKEISLADTAILQRDKETFIRFWGHYYAYEYYKANENTDKAEQEFIQLLNLKKAISKPVWKALQLPD